MEREPEVEVGMQEWPMPLEHLAERQHSFSALLELVPYIAHQSITSYQTPASPSAIAQQHRPLWCYDDAPNPSCARSLGCMP